MDVAEWQEQLENVFGEGDIVGPHLAEVLNREAEFGAHVVEKYRGHFALMAAFQSHFVDTLRTAERRVASDGWPPDCSDYGAVLLTYLTVFRSFRACESLLLCGYPLDGFALLRDVKDRSLYLWGIARGKTNWSELNSMDRKVRKAAEMRVYNLLLGPDSGFSTGELAVIRVWEELFHQEVHGSKLTLVTEMKLLMDGGQMSVGPLPNERQIVMYMNRAAEAGWMLTKLLPYLQPSAGAFGAEWTTRQRVLDESFRFMEQGLEGMGKTIATVFISLIDRSYTFGEQFHYVEAGGEPTGGV